MGLVIGNTPGALGALTGSSRVRSVALLHPRDRSRQQLPSAQEKSNFLGSVRQNDSDTPRVGLGSGAASGPNLAFQTVRSAVEGVDRNRPSLAEISSRNQDRAAQTRARFQSQQQERYEARTQENRNEQRVSQSPALNKAQSPFASSTSNRVESRLPEPSVQARNFVSTQSETAAEVLVRAGEVESRESSNGPSIQINGESISFGNRSTGRTQFNATA